MLSTRYYTLLYFSFLFLLCCPVAFYFYATDPTKDSAQGFLGAMSTIIFWALFLIFQVYSYRQKDIDLGLYEPPDWKWKKLTVSKTQ